MNRLLAFVGAAAVALTAAACTAEATLPAPATGPTVNPLPPQENAVIDSFGYGRLKLGMSREEAVTAKLIGPVEEDGGTCTLHKIAGTPHGVYVSAKLGVATIFFTDEMTASKQYPAATKKPEFPYTYEEVAPGNDKAVFTFAATADGNVNTATLNLKGQDCHS